MPEVPDPFLPQPAVGPKRIQLEISLEQPNPGLDRDTIGEVLGGDEFDILLLQGEILVVVSQLSRLGVGDDQVEEYCRGLVQRLASLCGEPTVVALYVARTEIYRPEETR